MKKLFFLFFQMEFFKEQWKKPITNAVELFENQLGNL